MNSDASTKKAKDPGYEVRDASVPIVGWTVLGIAAGVALCLGLCGVYYKSHYKAGEFSRETDFQDSVSAQSSIARVWPDLDRATGEHLHGYGWVDRKAGIVHIPIERAMDLLARENAGNPGKAAK